MLHNDAYGIRAGEGGWLGCEKGEKRVNIEACLVANNFIVVHSIHVAMTRSFAHNLFR